MNQDKNSSKLFFASDYMEGAHPLILQRLMETNLLHTAGYGTDEFSESARAKVRKACNAPVHPIPTSFSLSAERRPTPLL